MPLLKLLGSPELDKPAYFESVQRLMCSIYEHKPLGITSTICIGGISSKDDAVSLAWFYTTVAVKSVEARNDRQVRELCEKLSQFPGCGFKGLQTVLGGGDLEGNTGPILPIYCSPCRRQLCAR